MMDFHSDIIRTNELPSIGIPKDSSLSRVLQSLDEKLQYTDAYIQHLEMRLEKLEKQRAQVRANKTF